MRGKIAATSMALAMTLLFLVLAVAPAQAQTAPSSGTGLNNPKKSTPTSLYFHIFDARLRLGGPTNDFARWFRDALGLPELAERVSGFDPYAHRLSALRALLLDVVRTHLSREAHAHA